MAFPRIHLSFGMKQKQRKYPLAIVLAGLLIGGVSYANKEATLEAGGTDSWTVRQEPGWDNITGKNVQDKLHIKNGDGSGSFTFESINLYGHWATGGPVRELLIDTDNTTGTILIKNFENGNQGTTAFQATMKVTGNTRIENLNFTAHMGTTNMTVDTQEYDLGIDNLIATRYAATGYSNINVSGGNVNIGNISIRDVLWVGGFNINVNADKNLVIGSTSFNMNGTYGKESSINLKAGGDISVTNLAGRFSHSVIANAGGAMNIENLYFDINAMSDLAGFLLVPKSKIQLDAGKEINIGNIRGLGHSEVIIKSNEDIRVGNATFDVDACITYECRGVIDLQGKNIYVQNIVGGTANESGVGSFNEFRASGDNFYAGRLNAISLATALNNGYVDLRGITGEIVIDTSEFRNSTFYGDNFHFNHLTISTGSILRSGHGHPNDGAGRQAYTGFDTHIGKSFVNYLSLTIGTSPIDAAALWFKAGGDIMNFNLVDARATSYLNTQSIQETNINILNTTQAGIYLKNAHINTIVSKNGQTFIADPTYISSNALNVNTLLHLKNSSKMGGQMTIDLLSNTTTITQDFSKYLNVGVDSESLKTMSASELQTLLDNNKVNITADNQNTSGTYITTSDGKHYILLPDVKQVDGIVSSDVQHAQNGGSILIEQNPLTQGTLNNYGKILIDNQCDLNDMCIENDTNVFTLKGNLNNYNTLDVGAYGLIDVSQDVNNYGKMIFRLDVGKSGNVEKGSLKVAGAVNFDISPGSSGAFQADVADYNTLANLKLKSENTTNEPTYVFVRADKINYTYTYGNYTTTFSKDSISTEIQDGMTCNNADCQTTTGNNDTQQETQWTTGGKENPWDMDKAQTDSNTGGSVEKPVGGTTNDGTLIQKPSQADKEPNCDTTTQYCGFGGSENATEIERGYDYAQGRLEKSFGLTFMGASIDGKYLSVEKVVTDNLIGVNIIKKDINGFDPNNPETPLCNSQSSTFDCALYMEAGGNNSWINAIKAESKNSYEILKNLFYHENSELIFLVQLDQTLAISRNLAYFLEVGRTLDTAFQHVSSLENKSSTLNTLTLAMDSAKANRLVRMATIHENRDNEAIAFQNYQKNLEQALQVASEMRFASSGDNVDEVWFDTLADLIMRFNKRDEYPNNAWINMLGNLNFSTTGTSQLYGFNAGYDYLARSINTAMGLYIGYGYGIFTGSNNGFISNTSNNLFAGIYTRTFDDNHEYDTTISIASGFVDEQLGSRVGYMALLDLFNQKYTYNLNNLEANFTYGYAFILKKGYVLKPFIGTSYYLSSSTGFNRKTEGVFAVTTDDNFRQAIGFNLGIEGRKYFANQSYVFLLGQVKQDVFIISDNLDSARHSTTSVGTIVSAGGGPQTQMSLDYKGQSYRSSAFITGGGEYSFGKWYLNGSLSVQSALFQKNFSFGLNLGARMIF